MNHRAWGGLLTVAIVLCACTLGTPYHHFLPLPQEGWGRADTVSFALPVMTDAQDCSLHVELRATRLYPYTDLWMGVEQRDSDSVLLCRDTLHISMTDSTGCLSGRGLNLLEYTSEPLALAHMADKSCRQVRIFHLMSQETVTELTDVGLRITRNHQ